MAEAETEFVNEKWLAVERVILKGGVEGILFQPVDDSGKQLEEYDGCIYDIKGIKHVIIGSVYSVPTLRKGDEVTIKPGQVKWLRQWQDSEGRATLKMKESVFNANKRAAKLELDAKKEEMLDFMEPLRKVYWETNEAGRAQLEVELLRYLRRGKAIYVRKNK